MGMRELEAEILRNARSALRNHRLRQKDILEWKNARIDPQVGEVVIELTGLGIWVSVGSEHDKRRRSR